MSKQQGVSFHSKATIVPTSFGSDRRQERGGVWTNSAPVNEEIFRVGRLKNLAVASDFDPFGDNMPSAVFAGYAINHFGHFLTESIGCLPNVPSTQAIGPLVFLAGNRKSRRLRQWQMDLLRALGWSGHARIIDQTTLVENLVVPENSFHQNKTGYGDKTGLLWRNAVFPDDHVTAGTRIYVSRSELDSRLGRFRDEKRLEDRLREHGFAILHPQNMTIDAQVKAYKEASHVVLAESSAIHLLNLVCSSSQKIALLQRRPKVHGSIRRATRYFARAQIVGINAISSFEGKSGEAWPDYRGVSTIDFDVVLSVLEELSFLRSSTVRRAGGPSQESQSAGTQSSQAVSLLSRVWEP